MNKILPRYFTLIVLLFTLLSCKGQDKQNITDKNETLTPLGKIENPTGDVYCGYLDKKGDMWFGTNNGIYKFDGNEFTHYSEHEGLCNNKISCITQDINGNLWFGTANGICIFNGKEFTQLDIPKYEVSTDWLKKTYPIVNPNEVQSIIQDKNGIFWIGTNGAGAYRYDGKTFTNYLSEIGRKQADSLYHNIIQSITEDDKGNIWFSSMTHGGVSKYDGKNFTQFMPKDGLSDDMLRTSIVDRKGNIWFGFNGNRNSGLTYYDGKSFKTFSEKDGLCSKNIRAIFEDHSGKLWIGGMQGLCVYDGKNFTRFTRKDGQTYERIVFIVGDTDDNIWFGGKNGFWKYDGESVIDMTKGNK